MISVGLNKPIIVDNYMYKNKVLVSFKAQEWMFQFRGKSPNYSHSSGERLFVNNNQKLCLLYSDLWVVWLKISSFKPKSINCFPNIFLYNCILQIQDYLRFLHATYTAIRRITDRYRSLFCGWHEKIPGAGLYRLIHYIHFYLWYIKNFSLPEIIRLEVDELFFV